MPVSLLLLERAYRRPHDLRFEEALALAEQLGFEHVRTTGSHFILRHKLASTVREQFPHPLNLQKSHDGKAKGYQVKQMLQMAAALGIIAVPAEE